MSKASKKLLADLMREARNKSGLTLEEMSRQTGISKTQLWSLEARQRIDPRLSTVKTVCKHYGFSIAMISDFD